MPKLEKGVSSKEETNRIAPAQTTVLVTSEQLEQFGWVNTSQEDVDALNDTLNRYGITSKESITLFLATCGHESGKGKETLEMLNNDGTVAGEKYNVTDRGAGYIQITSRRTHLDFLESVGDDFKGEDTATYIAENYPWQASGWFWTSTGLGVPTGSLNEYVTQYGDSLGVFLITQYYVHSWPDESKDVPNKTFEAIRDGTVSWDVKNKTLRVEGVDTCQAPRGWEDRKEKYDEAIKIFN